MVKKFKILLLIFIAIIIVGGCVFSKKMNKMRKSIYINSILSQKSYSYLSNDAKDYIKKIYEDTGEVILTEKNKEDNKPYLNPDYIQYLELSDEEKEKVELIPDNYVLDYEVNKSYSTPSLPSSYDLKNVDGKNFVSSIKNQGTTEICWAFASIENIETMLMKQTNQSYSNQFQKFSVRQLDYVTSNNSLVKDASWISCSGNCSYTPYNNKNNGSRSLGKGGNFFTSSIIMSNALSLTDESVLPWTEKNDPKWPKDIMGYDKSLYEVNSTIQMPTINEDSASEELINSYVNDIKNYMIQYGGPFVGTYSPKSTCGFENTDGTKAIKTDDCTNDTSNNSQNHAMQIIGWDDNYEYSYCDAGTKHYSVKNGNCTSGKLTQGKGAWVVRNSWGEDSEEGNAYRYVYLTYDSTRLSIGFTTSISEMSNRSWDNNYHVNPWIDSNISNGMASVSEQTKEFDTHNKKSEKIEKVKFITASKNGKYKLSVITNDKEYNNVATINSNEVGIYTVDLSDKNIIIKDKNFSVKIVGENNDKFYNDSVSVFTSNIDSVPAVTTYSGKAYDSTKPLSDLNPLYVSGDNYWYLVVNTYLKNIPANSDLTYRVQKDGIIATERQIADFKKTIVNDIGSATFSGDYSSSNVNFSTQEAYGNTYTFEILYGDIVVDSFPIKFSGKGATTKSNVRLYANNGTDYYYDTKITDKTTSTFKLSSINSKNFYNKGYYITSWNTKADGTGDSYGVDEAVLIYHDMELYAQWSNETLDVKFNFKCKYSDNCSGTMNSITANINDDITMPENSFIKDEYKFTVWRIDDRNHSSLKLYEQEKRTVSELLKSLQISYNRGYFVFNNMEIDVDAYWSNNSKTISFDSNGGTGNMKNISLEPIIIGGSAATQRIKDNLFTRDGYTFKNWNTEADGSGTSYTSYIPVEEDLKLYAQWEKISVSITTDISDIDYGTVETNFPNHITKNVTLTNNGSVPVSLSLKNPTGDGPFGCIDFTNGKKLQPGESYSLVLIANSSSSFASIAGSYSGKYVITATEVGGERKATAEVTSVIKLIVPFKVRYQAHIQDVGWQEYKENGATAGAVGQSKRLEGIKIKLENAPYSGNIEYSTHVQNIGWMDFVKNGEMSGTSGKALRVEAIKIRLNGDIANYYDVYYRVNCESLGWLGWAKNGEQAGSSGYAYRLEGIEIKLIPKGETFDRGGEAFKRPEPSKVTYKTHVQEIGWQADVSDGKTSGTVGQAKRLEGIKINLGDNLNGNIEYSTHVQNIGWMDYVKNGEMSGTSGRALRLEAIKIRLTGQVSEEYDVYYRVHAESFGWLGWAKNDEQAGSSGYAYRLEGIEIKLIPKGETFDRGGEAFKRPEPSKVTYKTHVQEIGWQADVSDGKTSGTVGQAKRLEGIKINLGDNLNGNIEYSTHVQNIGWMDYVKNGEMSGTSGRALRLEAIKIRLTGQVSEEYDVYYRVHAESFGWLGWAKNDEMAGTSGYGYRLEAIEIKLVKKGESISSGNSFISR